MRFSILSFLGIFASLIVMSGCGQMKSGGDASSATAASVQYTRPQSLPTGVILVGDLGVASTVLRHVDSSKLNKQLQSTSGSQATGLTINIIWDASVANAPAGFQSVVQQVAQFYESQFSNPITLNITVGWGEIQESTLGSSSIGESESYMQSFNYSDIVAAFTRECVIRCSIDRCPVVSECGTGRRLLLLEHC